MIREPVLSIVIVNWNTRDLLAECLASIYEYPPADPFEVLVVDNASTDGSVDMLRRRFPTVRALANSENIGFARGNNQAMRARAGAHVLMLNSDARVLPGTVANLLDCLARHPEAGVVGGKLLNPDGSFQASGNRFPSLASEVLLLTGVARWIYSPYFPSYAPWESRVTRTCDWVGGACLLARGSTVDRVGPLDESYAMYVEEVDWCYRMRAVGWKVMYCAEAPVIHHGGASARRRSVGQLQRLYTSKAQFLRRTSGRRSADAFRMSVRAVALVQALRWSLASLISAGQHDREQAGVYAQVARAGV
jgi:N-acetylglucosaminyl-diphospho-decaprenol L-rhamnosyltransferase